MLLVGTILGGWGVSLAAQSVPAPAPAPAASAPAAAPVARADRRASRACG